MIATRTAEVGLRALGAGGALVALVVLLGCGEEPATLSPLERADPEGRVPTPASVDAGERCSDVGEVRACWTSARGPRCEDGVCLVPRPTPPGPALRGWRCEGAGEARTCVDRARLGSPMACEGDACEQRHPHLPDPGQWECADDHGLVVCRLLAEAAGVPASPRSPGWTCGERRGAGGELCVDASPDRPDGEGWSCRFDHEGGERRRCEREASAKMIGGACDSARGCPRSALCVQGRCLPLTLAPECWTDEDCGRGECALARCVEAP